MGKEILRAGYENKQGNEILRTRYGYKNFISPSFFN